MSLRLLLALLGVLHDVSSMLKLHLENCDRLARFRYEMSGATGGAPLGAISGEGNFSGFEDEPGEDSSWGMPRNGGAAVWFRVIHRQ